MKLFYSLLLGAVMMVSDSLDLGAHNPSAGEYEVNRGNSRNASWNYRPDEIIVKFKTDSGTRSALTTTRSGVIAGAKSPELNTMLQKYGVSKAEGLMPLTGGAVSSPATRSKDVNGECVDDANLSSLYLIKMESTTPVNIQEAIEDFKTLDEVEYAEPNYMVQICAEPESFTSDPLYPQQWGPAAIGLDKLWNVPTITSRRPIIAILDTGVDITHPDLADNIWINSHEANGADNRDDDCNGFIDDIHGWDFVNDSPRMRDNNGHGTHCAGIAGAIGGNGIGITGANPDAYIMPITVLQSNGTGDIATIIKGLDYAAANGADIISMSFGTYSTSLAFHDALGKAYHKAILVAAAGNDGLCINPHYCPYDPQRRLGKPSFPAAYSFVLGVQASSSSDGERAGFSNFDCDGPLTSTYYPSALYNYELFAPGTGIISTFPNGQYKTLNGTSMACPLVAGAISRLTSCREISSKEELFGDLIATSNRNMDIFSAYSLSDTDRKPTLSLVTYRLDDVKMGDGDGRPDAGEIIRIYPTFRNSWGNAQNITYSLRLHELEDPNIIEFISKDNIHVMSNLSSYATIDSDNPFIIKIGSDCSDGRIIRMVLTATCDNISENLYQEIELKVENGIELGGLVKEDLELSPNNHYIITSTLSIPQNVTLTILPGTILRFKDGTSIAVDMTGGKINACGTPDERIIFTNAEGEKGETFTNWEFGYNSLFKYCEIENIRIGFSTYNPNEPLFYKSLIHDLRYLKPWNAKVAFDQCSIYNNYITDYGNYSNATNSNVIRNELDYARTRATVFLTDSKSRNSFSNFFHTYLDNKYFISAEPSPEYISQLIKLETPSYFGSNNPNILSQTIWDINNPFNITEGTNSSSEIDLSNRLTRPNPLAPGIVWKVVVNDYDAQDEYEYLPPLGVGRHKFEVYFSKPMNHEKTPFIAMGVREPYTQTAISEDGEWRSETMENGDVIDVYTVYFTIKGKDNFDGLNTIYVSDAEDEEFFPIPIEDVRFHVNVQSAGAMSTGFTAEAGVGKVKLSWENPEENFEDMLGYNMYRYTLDENEVVGDTIKINENLLTKEELIDYDIVPGKTYCYYYKVLRTSLDENAPSCVVAATPRAAGKGDADASGSVDVADVVTEVNYMVGREPKPFIFDAADINEDNEIDILDVVGTVNIIMHPQTASVMMSEETKAVFTLENGILYVDTPVELAGMQVDLIGKKNKSEFKTSKDLKGMEVSADWVDEETYRLLAFSLSGKTLEAGKHPILHINEAEVEKLMLVDPSGKLVPAFVGTQTGISSIIGVQINSCYPNPFDDYLSMNVNVASETGKNIELSLTNLAGVTLLSRKYKLNYGEQTVTLETSSLPKGFYIATLKIDGKNIQSVKAIKR